ncbi:DUF1292 domain-containing protein [Sporolactobacillus spathodeae]|uniref:UPF0473 protein JOC27_000830 n=1 Tax=Sporolactobacillus spathodeae TaxID=1465502 RepID=A0ABS2Q8U4_9BACL|nr:DUF1292 domain-containing protein [Sporolactobacillus spathodeae]MBM7657387.1 uncharacterized protein YrzB (UPF0473 family) [Sporolactobacillus spathodeae]
MSDHKHYPIILPSDEEQERIVIPMDGEENLFDVLFYFDVPETGKSYVVCQPVEENEDTDLEDDEDEVFAFRYEEGESDEDFKLFPIDTDEEWEMVEEMINTFSDEEEE